MLKKIIGLVGVCVSLTAGAAAASAAVIAEYDFGRETLRVEGENYSSCEYPEIFDEGKTVASDSRWSGGKTLRITQPYSLLPEADADQKLSFTYSAGVAEPGNYRIMFQASGYKVNTITDTAYVSQWDAELDGAPVTLTPTASRTNDITSIWYVDMKLSAGQHEIKINVPKAEKPTGDSTRFYFTLDYIDFHYYYDIEHDFSRLDRKDSAASDSAFGSGKEFAKFVGDNAAPRYAEFDINAEKSGSYILDLCAQQENHGSISKFDLSINGEKQISSDVLNKTNWGTPVFAANTDRQFLRNYRFVINLKEGSNKLRFTSRTGFTNQWFLIDTMRVSELPGLDGTNNRIEAESAENLTDLYAALTHGSAKLIGYKDFSGSVALQTYGTPAASTDKVELNYKINASQSGLYQVGMLCNGAGSDFDMMINGIKYEKIRANSTRGTGAVAKLNSNAATDMFLHSYNKWVYLQQGENSITVSVLARTDQHDYIVDLDYFDFNFKESVTGAKLSVDGITYNGVSPEPSEGDANAVKVLLSNLNPIESNGAAVYIAVYDGSAMLKDVYQQNCSFAPNGQAELDFEGVSYAAGDTLKLFAWENMKPILNDPYTYKGNDNV